MQEPAKQLSDSNIESRSPYVWVYDKTGSTIVQGCNNDLGDVTLGLDYQPFKSSGEWPTTTFTLSAILPTGRSPYKINRDTDLPTGGGLYGVSFGMNMSKSIDPAMAFGGISAVYRLKRQRPFPVYGWRRSAGFS